MLSKARSIGTKRPKEITADFLKELDKHLEDLKTGRAATTFEVRDFTAILHIHPTQRDDAKEKPKTALTAARGFCKLRKSWSKVRFRSETKPERRRSAPGPENQIPIPKSAFRSGRSHTISFLRTRQFRGEASAISGSSPTMRATSFQVATVSVSATAGI